MGRPLLFASAAALIATGVGACTSSPFVSPPPGTLAAGTAKVTINDRTLPEMTAVKCMSVGSLTKIATGDRAAGVTVFVSNATGLTANSVSINNVGGFTGSYMEGLGDRADVSLKNQTYTIRGRADGFDTDKPSMRAVGTFRIQVAC